MDFLDKYDGNRPPAENETDNVQHLQNLSYNPFLTENSDGGNK
jgi:hypothetical protein